MKKIFIISCLILGLFGLWQVKLIVFAETSGSSPESGTSSRIKTAYDWLVAKGTNYGSTDAPDWDSTTTYPWGTWWNRIMEAAAWEPDGTTAVGDVSLGKTFYSGSDDRTIKTGTYDPATSLYKPQSLVEWDDYKTGDETGEESTWTNTAGTATTGVWKDGRTSLYWSASQGSMTNIFPDTTHTTCDYFNQTLYPTRGAYPGGDADCGLAINACGTLDLAAGGTSSTDWYLPSQKELQQANIDGIYNQTDNTFVSTNYYWSSTELSTGATTAWLALLTHGFMNNSLKTNSFTVGCVRRD